MQIIFLITGIFFTLFPIYVLKNIDKLSHNKAWIDKYLSYESKRSCWKVFSLLMLASGILIIISSIMLIVLYNEPVI